MLLDHKALLLRSPRTWWDAKPVRLGLVDTLAGASKYCRLSPRVGPLKSSLTAQGLRRRCARSSPTRCPARRRQRQSPPPLSECPCRPSPTYTQQNHKFPKLQNQQHTVPRWNGSPPTTTTSTIKCKTPNLSYLEKQANSSR
ncbi:Os11g0584000 [Oryza sativa Japonica Group]|uniref:Os11g0584000 protein n=1 Tax=Oryza sativa subsp. japonica TaxID=39947 RepID=A0A0P0Y3V2_ORYSJ|nr:Os11g0584000 [Oryza sativa Japonica Group]